VKLDGPPPSSLVSPPYTVVVDDRVVGVVRTRDDSTTWKSVDIATVKSVEIVRGADAAARFPTAVGAVVRITRCY
jgi:outer membrane cobalamin receptor